MSDAMASPAAVRVERLAEDAVRLVMDQPGKSANVLSRPFQESLAEALDIVQAMPDVRTLILLSAKPRIFVAGADLNAIVDNLDWDDSEVIAFCEYGRRLYQRFQEGPWTSVAAIQGACVGGGLELALGCDYRVAADDPRPLFGLPETRLGLIPGWAGTVRLPRLMDLDEAIGLVTSSQLFSAARARELGLVDEVVPAGELLETALRFGRDPERIAARAERRRRQLGPALTCVDDPSARHQLWSERVRKAPTIWPFAPETVARHMIDSAPLDFEEACASEARAMARVWGSPPSRGLLNAHFLAEHNRRSPGREVDSALGKPVRRVGLVGCGWMGRAIARLAAGRGGEVWLNDADRDAAGRAAAECGERGRVADNLEQLAACDLVLECVSERVEVKRPVLEAIGRAVPPDTLVATNTSTIPVSELAAGLPQPGRFCGIHFCHPGLLDLVEIVPGEQTGETTLATALGWTRSLGKAAVFVRDQPGFVVNRLLQSLVDAAVDLFVRGVPVGSIDRAMESLGMLAGPFAMMDEIGIDTMVLGGRAMARRGVAGASMAPVLPRMVRHGRLGRKAGRGFYLWQDETSRSREPDPAALALVADCQGDLQSSTSEPFREESLQHELLIALLLAATTLLDERAVGDPRDVDFCLIKGLGFPAAVGGILFWADSVGPEKVGQLLEGRTRFREMPSPSSLRKWMEGADWFYPHGSRRGPRWNDADHS